MRTSIGINEATRQPLLARLTPHNLGGFARYLYLRLRYNNLKVGLFFIDKGAQIRIEPLAHIKIGPNLRIMRDFTAHFRGKVEIGEGVFFNRGCHVVVYSSLKIGNHCLFGEGVSIHDEDHLIGQGSEPIASRGMVTAPIVLGNNVWVGAKATILKGVCIGDNAVIGANAVVTHDIPANTLAVGIPAIVKRKL